MQAQFKPSEGFKGLWVPICILIDQTLSLPQKIILSEIYQLQKNDSGECYASNAHFGALANCKERNVRNHLAALVEKNLIWPYEATNRRRLAITKHVREGIEAESQTPITRQQPAANSAHQPTIEKKTRQTSASQPGKNTPNPATECLPTRHLSATESTRRKQPKNTIQNTTALGGLIKSGGISADTHIRDDRGRALAKVRVWKEWIAGYKPYPGTVPLTESEQRMKLAEMVREGFNGDDLLEAAIEICEREFWSPPSWVVPDELKEKYGCEERTECCDAVSAVDGDDDIPF